MENTIEKETLIQLVTFRLDPQVYALPIEPIQQVIEMVTITPVPQVQASVEGVINYHGVIVPIVNLREQLGLQKVPKKLHTPILMVFVSERLIGLIVDEVLDVIHLPSTQMAKPQDILPEGLKNTSLLRGLFHEEMTTIFVLDLDHLFEPREATALAEIIAKVPGTVITSEKPVTQTQNAPAMPDDVPPAKTKKKRTNKKASGNKEGPETRGVETPA